MKKFKKAKIHVLVLLSIESLCCWANARWGSGAGLNVPWGPNRPRVRPRVDFDIYNGGGLGN